jgi:hypothetical protein
LILNLFINKKIYYFCIHAATFSWVTTTGKSCRPALAKLVTKSNKTKKLFHPFFLCDAPKTFLAKLALFAANAPNFPERAAAIFFAGIFCPCLTPSCEWRAPGLKVIGL